MLLLRSKVFWNLLFLAMIQYKTQSRTENTVIDMNCRNLLWMTLVWRGLGMGTALLFPASSVLQITSAFSAPIENPNRRIFWDWGIQMNYDLPFNLDKFINVPIWADKFDFDDRKRRDLDYKKDQPHQQHYGNHSLWHIADKYKHADVDVLSGEKHPSDFSAGELYYGLENLLTSYGFHETCLLRSVCELAHHPFNDDRQNLITEILSFLLTPSLHEAFSDSESMYRDAYEEAERRGFMHYNCANLYRECKQDLLATITNIAANGDMSASGSP